MMSRIRLWLDTLRTSLWFVPTLIVLASVVLAHGLLALDASLPADWWKTLPGLGGLRDVRINGAVTMLQMIGGSMITIAGVVFSITIAAITLAAGQYTSRVLRNFIRDRANQAVLGAFLGIFVFCVLVMRSVSTGSMSGQAPPLTMLMALVLAFLGIGLLIFFIHHIVLSLQAASVVAAIARDALPSIDRHFPERFAPVDEDEKDVRWPEGAVPTMVHALRSGYVTGIDVAALTDSAVACDGLVHVRRAAGMFVAEGEVLAELHGPNPVDEAVIRSMQGAWSYANQRTLANDPGYGVRQLVDVALMALSPGINQTTTCVMCVNWLGVMLLRMSERRFPPRWHAHENVVRVVTNAYGIAEFIDQAFNQIRQQANGNLAVLKRMLEVLLALAESEGKRVVRQPILLQADAIEDQVRRKIAWPPDRTVLESLLTDIRRRLGVDRSAHAASDR